MTTTTKQGQRMAAQQRQVRERMRYFPRDKTTAQEVVVRIRTLAAAFPLEGRSLARLRQEFPKGALDSVLASLVATGEFEVACVRPRVHDLGRRRVDHKVYYPVEAAEALHAYWQATGMRVESKEQEGE